MTLEVHRFGRLTSTAAFFLLIAGGLVTSTRSGLAVPDWPLSFGQFFPPMVGGVFFEHGHRMIAGIVALLTFGLGGLIASKETRRWVRMTALAACAAIVVQAVLGGLTVLLRLPPVISVSHACLAQGVFCLILTLTQATSPWYIEASRGIAGGLWKPCAGAAAAVYLQLIFGALARHSSHGTGYHVAWALPASASVAFVVLRIFRVHPGESSLTQPAAALAALLPLQLILGVVSLAVRRSSAPQAAGLTAAHVAVGALLLGTTVITALRAHRIQ